jgi:hypothetical protein
MAAQDDDLGDRHPFAHNARQLQPIHEGHLDVCNQDVGLNGLQEWQGDLAVGRFTAKLEAVAAPIDLVSDTLAGYDLILHEEDFVRHSGLQLSFVPNSAWKETSRRLAGFDNRNGDDGLWSVQFCCDERRAALILLIC